MHTIGNVNIFDSYVCNIDRTNNALQCEMETIELNSINATSHKIDNVKIILLHTVFY